MFCKTITLYYPHFCIIFSTQLIPGDITELDVCILNKLGIFFYVVICLHNIFAKRHSQLFFVIKEFKNLQLQHKYMRMAHFNLDQNTASLPINYTKLFVCTWQALLNHLENKKPVAAISKLLTFIWKPWLLLQCSGYNFELTQAYDHLYVCKSVFIITCWVVCITIRESCLSPHVQILLNNRVRYSEKYKVIENIYFELCFLILKCISTTHYN